MIAKHRSPLLIAGRHRLAGGWRRLPGSAPRKLTASAVAVLLAAGVTSVVLTQASSPASAATSTLTLTKNVVARANAADQFTISIGGGATASATTTGAGTGTQATAGPITTTANTTYTLTEAMAAGSVSTLAAYSSAIVCTDTTTSTPITTTGSGPNWSLLVPNADNYSCAIVNQLVGPDCAGNVIYGLDNDGNTFTINVATGVTAFYISTPGVASNTANGLAISSTNLIDEGLIGVQSRIDTYSAATGTYTQTSSPLGFRNVIEGAIDPVNGYYYFGDGSALYAYNPATNTMVGEVATIFSSTTGDIAFDSLGNLYEVAGNSTLIRYPAPPTVAGSGALPQTVVTSSILVPGQINGMAFGGDGYLYLSGAFSADSILQINPITGVIGSTITETGAAVGHVLDDLASCAATHTVTLQKNIASRSTSTDQFSLSITGGGLTTGGAGNTGVTAGATTGLQTTLGEVAGPALDFASTTYTLAETGVGSTNLANYTQSISCVDTISGAAVSVTPLSSTSWSYTTPATFPSTGSNVQCTVTNTSLPTDLSITKTDNAATYLAPQTSVYSFAVTNSGNQTVNDLVIQDSGFTGTGTLSLISCLATTLVPGQSETCTATYAITAADLGNGMLDNTAIAIGEGTDHTQITSGQSTATVTPSTGLAFTGVDSQLQLILGGLLLALGALLLLAATRRRPVGRR